MKTLFLGHFAAGVAPRILAKVETPLESSILDDEGDAAHLGPLLEEAEIVVGHTGELRFRQRPACACCSRWRPDSIFSTLERCQKESPFAMSSGMSLPSPNTSL
jgi:hypothetical protein